MNEVLLYIINSAVWSLGGLVAGFLMGRTTAEVHAIKKHLEERDFDFDDDDT